MPENERPYMFDFDKPITRSEQDSLGFDGFAKAVAEAIACQEGRESFVIGVYGKWGSGKTSTMNLMMKHLKAIGKSDSDDGKDAVVAISFSCWGARSVSDLLSMFSETLASELKRGGKATRSLRSVASELSRYASSVAGLSPEASAILSAVGVAVDKAPSPAKLKQMVGKTLGKQEKRVVVIIDDLDRLPDEQIKSVFQFVSAVADFPNVVYILPFDYDVVAEALSGVQGVDGSAYMDKIVQVPLSMPAANKDDLTRLLDEGLSPYIDASREDYSKGRMQGVVLDMVIPHLNTMRDVKRLHNVTRFQLDVLSEELNIVDVIGISALLAFRPSVYRWVGANKDMLLHKRYGESQESYTNRLKDSLTRSRCCEKEEADQVLRSLEGLFPLLSSPLLESDAKTCRERRICNSIYFDSYFASSIEGFGIPSRDAVNAVMRADRDDAKDALECVVADGSFRSLLRELESRYEELDSVRLVEMIRLLFGCLGKSEDEHESGFFYISTDSVLQRLLRRMLKSAGKADAAEIIEQALAEIDLAGLCSFAVILNAQELAFGKLAADSVAENKQLVDEGSLERIEHAFIDRVHFFARDPLFVMGKGLYMLMYLWSCLDEAGYRKYWEDILSRTPSSICWLISASATTWKSSDGDRGWKLSGAIFGKVKSYEDIVGDVEALKRMHAFADMDREALLRTIAFCESEHLPGEQDVEDDSATAEMAAKLESTWR